MTKPHVLRESVSPRCLPAGVKSHWCEVTLVCEVTCVSSCGGRVSVYEVTCVYEITCLCVRPCRCEFICVCEFTCLCLRPCGCEPWSLLGLSKPHAVLTTPGFVRHSLELRIGCRQRRRDRALWPGEPRPCAGRHGGSSPGACLFRRFQQEAAPWGRRPCVEEGLGAGYVSGRRHPCQGHSACAVSPSPAHLPIQCGGSSTSGINGLQTSTFREKPCVPKG